MASAHARHEGPSPGASAQPGETRDQEAAAGRSFNTRNRNRGAGLAAIFNEDWADPTQVLGVSVAFGKSNAPLGFIVRRLPTLVLLLSLEQIVYPERLAHGVIVEIHY